MLRKSLGKLLLFVLLISVVATGVIKLGWALPTEITVVNPQTGDGNFIFYTNEATIGTRFNATVWLYDVTDLLGYQVMLNVDDTLLSITNAWFPTWDPQWVFQGKLTYRLSSFDDIDEDGYFESVIVGAFLFPAPPQQETFTGSGTLAIIEFEIVYAPTTGKVSCSLDIDNEDTFLVDSYEELIETAITSGYYEYVGPAIIYVEPAEVIEPTLVPSSYFDINITIANATAGYIDVYSFKFNLSYDPTVLNAVNATLGNFFPQTVVPQLVINNTAGYLFFSASLTPPETPVSGSGILTVITFHVEGLGATALDLYDTELADESGKLLPHTAEDGFFFNIAKLYVEPQKLIDTRLKPSFIFSVDVVIDDVVNLYGYEFKLGYNTSMLTGIEVLVHPVLNETSFSTKQTVDDEAGLMWVNVTYHQPTTPITTYAPESLVTLTFMVDNVGSSVLDLYDTSLVDHNQEPIPHEAKGGFVMTLRDVAIVNVVPSLTFVYAGALVDINVTAQNKGNVTETFDVSAYWFNETQTVAIGTQKVTDLAPLNEETITFTWNTSDVSDGNYTIKGEATFVPDEFNTTDNVYIDGTVEVRTRIRDLAILSVTVNPNITYVGWPVNITVVAENQGMDPETFEVSVYWNDTNLIAKETFTLDPNATITHTFTWYTTNTLECNKYKISAQATLIPEFPIDIDTVDNKLDDGYVKIKIMGDINGDGKVDIINVDIAAQALGSYPGHPGWNPEADLNRDGKVDIVDLAMVASNFGKTCSS